MTMAARVLQRNLLVYRHVWKGSLFSSFLTPLLYLTAMGVGLGTLVSRQNTAALGGFDYLHFLGPGVLAATVMQSAVFESTYPIMGKIIWNQNYDALLATPMRVRDILAGELSWISFRITLIATVFMAVMWLFAIPRSPLALLAIPAAVLTGVSFSAPVIAFAATQRNDAGFTWMFRFLVNPLFLFSGTFFPIDRLPAAVQWVAAATPLYHGVALIRSLVLLTPDLDRWWLHTAYLLIFFGVTAFIAERTLRRRLVK